MGGYVRGFPFVSIVLKHRDGEKVIREPDDGEKGRGEEREGEGRAGEGGWG